MEDIEEIKVIGVQASVVFNRNHAVATDEVMALTQKLLENFGRNRKDPLQLNGDVYEFIEAWKFNRNAGLAGSDLRAEVSNAEGFPHDSTDIRIKRGSKIIKEVQAKSSKKPAWVLKAGAREDYSGKEILTNPENVDGVKDLAKKAQKRQTPHAKEFNRVAKRTKGELKQGEISSGGTSHEEAFNGAKDIKRLVVKERIKDGIREASVNAATSGCVAALASGLISGIKNLNGVANCELDGYEALKNTAKDSAKAGAGGALNGALGSAYRAGGKAMEESAKDGAIKIMGSQLKKANVAMAIATLTISTGATIWSLLTDEIDMETALSDLGENGTSCASGIFVGASAGMVFGPLGAAVGSMAGYIGAACVYNSLVSLMRSAKLAEEQARLAKKLCEQAVVEMQSQQQQFKEALEQVLRERQARFDDIIERVAFDDRASPLEACVALGQMASLFNVRIFSSFEEFDRLMLSKEPLRL